MTGHRAHSALIDRLLRMQRNPSEYGGSCPTLHAGGDETMTRIDHASPDRVLEARKARDEREKGAIGNALKPYPGFASREFTHANPVS